VYLTDVFPDTVTVFPALVNEPSHLCSQMNTRKTALWVSCLLVTALLFCNQLCAQPTGMLEGTIRDETGEPGSLASIGEATTNRYSVAETNGKYQLQLSPGVHKISCSMIGYESQLIEITINAGKTTVYNFRLKKAGNAQLEDVTVEGMSIKKTIETQGFAVNVIDTKEAALRNLQTNELLDRTVGVRVRQNGGLGASVEYNLNGMSGRAVGIFIDGIEISTYGSSFNLNSIPPAMIERIEVYKGVLPAHLSGDLLGGAINVVLKKGFTRNSFNASVSYGSFNTFQSDVSGMYRSKKTGFTARTSAFYSYSDNNYEVWGKFARNTLPDGTLENVRTRRFWDAYKSLGGRFEVGFTDVKWADVFLLGYNGSDTYKEIQHGQYMTQPYMGRFSESRANVFSLNYDKKNFITDGLRLTVNGVYSDRNQYIEDTVSWVYNWSGEKMIGFNGQPIKSRTGAQQGAPTMNTINRKIVNLRSNLGYNIAPNHRVTLNHVFYTVDRKDEDQARHVVERMYFATSDLSKNVFALNYEAQTIGGRLKTNLFGKLYQQNIQRISPYQETVNGEAVYKESYIDDNRNTTGFGLAASYTLTPRIILISSAEKAVRMPSEAEIFGGPEENIIANPALRPEISYNLNVGFRLGAFTFGQHKLSLSGNGFTRNIRDKIVRRAEDRLVNEAVQAMPFENLQLAQSIGFEGEVNYVYGKNLNIMFSFSKFNSLFKQEFDRVTGQKLDRYNRQLPNEPFFTMNGNIQYRINNAIQKASVLNLYYNVGYVNPFNTIWVQSVNTETPRQISQDFGTSYMFPGRRIVVSLDVKNMFNAEVYDNFAVQKPGRGFYMKLNYSINQF
jgi:outer membrane receptor protein involved in Fe transport